MMQFRECEKLSHRDDLEGRGHMRQLKIIVEKHPDGYVAYPLGVRGVVVGQRDTYEEAISDVKSAIRFHIKSLGKDVLHESVDCKIVGCKIM